MSTAQDATDPFAHLHDENYTQRFSRVRTGFAERVAMAGRARQSLDGTWLFILDLFDEGLRQKWYEDDPMPPQDWTAPRDIVGELADAVRWIESSSSIALSACLSPGIARGQVRDNAAAPARSTSNLGAGHHRCCLWNRPKCITILWSPSLFRFFARAL